MNTANPYAYQPTPVAQSPADVRAEFIRKTYAHFAAGLVLFSSTIWLLGRFDGLAEQMLASPVIRWGSLLGIIALGFGYRVFFANENKAAHYLGYGLTISLYAAMLSPWLYVANQYVPGVLGQAFLITTAGFGGLTAFAFFSKKDFSVMGGFLSMATMALLVIGLISMIAGFSMGLVWSGAVLLVYGGWVLYDTSMIQRHLSPDQYVFGATMLFINFVVMLRQVAYILLATSDD